MAGSRACRPASIRCSRTPSKASTTCRRWGPAWIAPTQSWRRRFAKCCLDGEAHMKKTIAALAALLIATTTAAETRGQWPYYGGDAGSSKYSALAQIDAHNVGSLE